MEKIYTDNKIKAVKNPSIFLAGPSPRKENQKSWREKAIKILEKEKYEGQLFIPEFSKPQEKEFDYNSQVHWEEKAMKNCSLIVFWVPRDLKEFPAFTTNVEFGIYIDSGRILYGRPDSAPNNRYLDWLYTRRTKKTPYNSLEELIKEAIRITK